MSEWSHYPNEPAEDDDAGPPWPKGDDRPERMLAGVLIYVLVFLWAMLIWILERMK